MFFFWYKPEEKARVISELRRMGREDLVQHLYGKPGRSLPGTTAERRASSGASPGGRQRRNGGPPSRNSRPTGGEKPAGPRRRK